MSAPPGSLLPALQQPFSPALKSKRARAGRRLIWLWVKPLGGGNYWCPHILLQYSLAKRLPFMMPDGCVSMLKADE